VIKGAGGNRWRLSNGFARAAEKISKTVASSGRHVGQRSGRTQQRKPAASHRWWGFQVRCHSMSLAAGIGLAMA
jgi:hypothetical protein